MESLTQGVLLYKLALISRSSRFRSTSFFSSVTLGTLVAVKVFHEHVNMSNKEDARELQLLRRLEHSNIIRLLTIEKLPTSNKSVLVLEYCEGGSLHHMLDSPQYVYGLHEPEFIKVLTHVSAGIQYLRHENVIHRDIKPGNIMRYITDEGISIYKLTDFGAARKLDDSESFESLCGTEEYLHPAIYEKAVLRLPNSQSFNAKLDLWSLGVTFYHTATGQLPFQAFGGRSNRYKMFDIISQKESGVISGVQKSENGAIEWKSDLPETSPLTSGLKSIIIPLLAGLMEPNEGKMLTYDAMFRIIQNIGKKITITVFHYNRCDKLLIYTEPKTTFAGLKDEIASLTDIPSAEQILLIGGQLLERVVDPLAEVSTYPESLRKGEIYLFQREATEKHKLMKPKIPPFPSFPPYVNIDEDARLAHKCAAQGELIKRYVEHITNKELLLMNGLMCLRIYVESRLAETKICQDFMVQLMDECGYHYDALFQLARLLRNSIARNLGLHRDSHKMDGLSSDVSHPDIHSLDLVLKDTAIREVHAKARERIKDIQLYRDALKKKIGEIKNFASQHQDGCQKEDCLKKVKYHLSQISVIQSRFRRDRSVRSQMTAHDQNIHGFERSRLEGQCAKMKSILVNHCLNHLDNSFESRFHLCESLTKCLVRVNKIEKNINNVLNCQKLLTDKLLKQKTMCTTELLNWESGYRSYDTVGNIAPDHQYQTLNLPVAQPGQMDINIGGAKGGSAGPNLLSPDEQYAQHGLSPQVTDGFQSMSGDTMKLQEKLQALQDMLTTNSLLIRGLDETSLHSSGYLSRSSENRSDADEIG
ncbi:hypothetical protein RRG08_004953 [Elysia crispata]|uniref:TANK-binding kinase 1 n=1 Tax=Elysia crispata TaxID=231223 RepID=A0AAE0ZHS5_9GAST|nr:hypothetical protein RRG08_004953 [Elysia crispata]